MASIERTAYPRFKQNPLTHELDVLYTPTQDELDFANGMVRKEQHRFSILLLLKTFQRLGYFPTLENIPPTIVQHVRIVSGICNEVCYSPLSRPIFDQIKIEASFKSLFPS